MFGSYKNVASLFSFVNTRRRLQLAILLVLQIVGAGSEVVSLGALVPLLGALAEPAELLTTPWLQPWLAWLGVTTPHQLIVLLAVLYACTMVAANALRLTTIWAQTRLAAAIGSDISVQLYRTALHQPYESYLVSHSGDLISTLTNDLRATLSVIQNCLMAVTQGLVVISVVGALLQYDPLTALALFMVGGVTYALAMAVSRRWLMRNSQRFSENNAVRVKVMQEGLGAIRDVLIYRTQSWLYRNYQRADYATRRSAAQNEFIRATPRYVLEAVVGVLICVILVLLTRDAGNMQSVLTSLGVVAVGTIRLLPALQQEFSSLSGIHAAHYSLQRTLDALRRPLDPVSLLSEGEQLSLDRSLDLEGVWFHYQDGRQHEENADQWVLKDVSLSIPANTTVAIVGPTGEGKSTLADIILGLLYPQKGRIVVDGRDLSGEILSAWRANVASVPQSVYLSDASLAENIAFGIPKGRIDMDRVKAAAAMAHLTDFVEQCPHGYDEMVGEAGLRLSGGQRQRVAIARALYRRKTLIVFDEATSALDDATEARVVEAIRSLEGRLTMVLISHRLSTLAHAGVYYEVRRGRVVKRDKLGDIGCLDDGEHP